MPKKFLYVGKTRYYGINNGKIITLYPHIYEIEIAKRKRRVTFWRTGTSQNAPTFHGKFYTTKEKASAKL